MRRSIPRRVLPTAILWLLFSILNAFAQGTAFTYQGRLNDNGAPANGVYDFTVRAFDSPTAGNSIGGTMNLNAVGVTNGLFTALVDLGSSPFTGPARWLQIRVSTNGAGSFITLVPRQALTPSPYAIFANTAGTVTNGAIASAQLAANSVATGSIQNSAVTAGKIASGQVVKSLNGLTDGVSLTQGANVTINPVGNSLQISAPAGGLNLPFSGTAASAGSIFTLSNSAAGAAGVFLGNVGIGTTTPQVKLHITTPDEGIRIQGSSSGVANTAYMSLVNGAGTAIGYVGDGSIHENSISLGSYLADIQLVTPFGPVLTATPGGNVGIGTATPQARLDVRGDIRLGSSGQFRATSSEESLRIIRGLIATDGTRVLGSGFTSSRSDVGDYLITFTTPFAGTPTVTASLEFEASTGTAPALPITDAVSTGSAKILLRYLSSSGTVNGINKPFHFIAVGPR